MWQPIETAPKDGTRVLLAGGSYPWEHWEGEQGPAVCHWFVGEWVVTFFDSKFAHVEYEAPTHWMPLPAPPADLERLE